MIRVGLTGGLACGKSIVGRTLTELGCHIIQADELGHEALQINGEAYAPVINEFGASILDPAGAIDRRKLAAIVFADPEELTKLSAIVHPAVGRLQQKITAEILAHDPDAIVVFEAAILVETGSYRNFDKLIVVACRPEQQLERAMQRDGFSREEVVARLGRQLPIEKKIPLAHYVIDTSGTPEHTVEQTREIYRSLRSLTR